MTQFLLLEGPVLFIHFVAFGSAFQTKIIIIKKKTKVSGDIASQAPLGRSYCPSQKDSPARRYRMTRLYMCLPIDRSETSQNLKVSKCPNDAECWILHWRPPLWFVLDFSKWAAAALCYLRGVTAHTCLLLFYTGDIQHSGLLSV